jgi:asparaginyl-tRNA synthetase
MEKRFSIKVNELRPDRELTWEYEWLMSYLHDEPFFIHDYPRGARGFYDREYADKPGYLMDFDLIFPHGYGEAISGAAREFDHKRVIPRMKESGESLQKYKWYLSFLQKYGKPTAGFGIGLERTVRYFCGLPSIMMALPYPKVPGLFTP